MQQHIYRSRDSGRASEHLHNIQGSKGLADTHAEEAKKERDAKRKRGADDARLDPHVGPMDNARDRNLKDAAAGKEIKRVKLEARKFVLRYHYLSTDHYLPLS
jgi:hypothetical protein